MTPHLSSETGQAWQNEQSTSSGQNPRDVRAGASSCMRLYLLAGIVCCSKIFTACGIPVNVITRALSRSGPHHDIMSPAFEEAHRWSHLLHRPFLHHQICASHSKRPHLLRSPCQRRRSHCHAWIHRSLCGLAQHFSTLSRQLSPESQLQSF